MKILSGIKKLWNKFVANIKRPTWAGFRKAEAKIMPIVWVITIVVMATILVMFALDAIITTDKWQSDEEISTEFIGVRAIELNTLPTTGSIKLSWDNPIIANAPLVISASQEITIDIGIFTSYWGDEDFPIYIHQIPVYQTALQTQTLKSQTVPGTGLLKEIVYSVPVTIPIQGPVEEKVKLFVSIGSEFDQVALEILEDGEWQPWDGDLTGYWSLIVDGEIVEPDEEGWATYRVLQWPYLIYLPVVLSN